MEDEIQEMNQSIQAVQMKIETMDRKIETLKRRIKKLDQRKETADMGEGKNDRADVGINRFKSPQESGDLRLDRWLALFTQEQSLSAQCYQELKSSIDDVYARVTAGQEQLNHVYKSLSQDILCVAGDYHQLKKRVKPLLKKGLQT